MSLAEQALSYVRAISPYQPGKPITELAREMGIPVEQILKLVREMKRGKNFDLMMRTEGM